MSAYDMCDITIKENMTSFVIILWLMFEIEYVIFIYRKTQKLFYFFNEKVDIVWNDERQNYLMIFQKCKFLKFYSSAYETACTAYKWQHNRN